MRQPKSSGAAQPRRAFYSTYFTLYVRAASTKKQELRLAFGARTGTAVVRNRAKRIAREAFRSGCYQLPDSTEFLISAKRGIATLSRRDMREQIDDLFEQARGFFNLRSARPRQSERC
ncbi:MAG: hypothetical protein C3F08_06345 [Candidatus Methylomirabilota bacterium]|nr:MAG: hypothetical protein C3F08_06345 [candidate division NC10 bacterium]